MSIIWKPVNLSGFEGAYEVSNTGMVKSLQREFIRSNGRRQPIPEKILQGSKDVDGYVKVELNNRGEAKRVSVHRLVAMAFLPNPDGKPQVNHINSKRDDNRVENLEWVTGKENSAHAFSNGFGRTGVCHPNSKQVGLFLDGKPIAVYETLNSCSDILNISRKALRLHINESKLLYGALEIKYISHQYPSNHYPFKRRLDGKLSQKPIKVVHTVSGEVGVYKNRELAEELNGLPREVLMYPLQKKKLYKNTLEPTYTTLYEYLMAEESIINRNLLL